MSVHLGLTDLMFQVKMRSIQRMIHCDGQRVNIGQLPLSVKLLESLPQEHSYLETKPRISAGSFMSARNMVHGHDRPLFVR